MSHIRELKHCLTGFRTYPPIRSTTHNHNLPFTHIHTHKPTHTRTQRSLFSSAGRPSPQMFPLRVISRIWGMFWSAGPMTRSKAPEISVAGPKRACALPAELHRDAELLLSRVSEGTEMIVCVCVFACMGHINFHPFFFLWECVAQQSCEISVLKSIDLFYVQIICWQPASHTHVFYSLIGETPHWPHLHSPTPQ